MCIYGGQNISTFFKTTDVFFNAVLDHLKLMLNHPNFGYREIMQFLKIKFQISNISGEKCDANDQNIEYLEVS